MVKNIALICNPLPGNTKLLNIADEIAGILNEKEISFSIFTSYWPQTWTDFSEAWIIGGDGTLNYFINQYPDLQLPITIFKAGSGNDFHWMMYGDLTLEKQIEKVLFGNAVYIDAGICNNKLFLNGVGVGFDGAIVKDLLNKKKVAGKASYLLSILKHIVGYQEKYYEIKYKGREIKQDCLLISIANGRRYGGGFNVTPNASVHDGLLDINIVGELSGVKRLRYLPVIEKGEHLELPFVDYDQTENIIIDTPSPVHAHRDGEYFLANHFEISCLPKKILFFV